MHDADRVARRTLVLAAVVCRGAIDRGVGDPDAESLYPRILTWLTQMGLWEEVEPNEEKLFNTPLGQLDQKDVIQAIWYVEGLSVLAWALQQAEFPRHDEELNPNDVTDSVWILCEDAEEGLRTASLRDRIQLNACRELQYAIHTRLRDFMRHGKSKDFTSWISQRWIKALGQDAAHLIINNDLAIDNKPISAVEENRVRECASITFERHRAIIWLVEGYPNYSQTPVDT